MNARSTPPPASPSYRSIAVVVGIVVLALLVTAGLKSYRDLAAARAHQAELEQQIAASTERIRVLRQRIRSIQEDPITLERLAREELGMVRPDDVVIVLPAEDEPAGP